MPWGQLPRFIVPDLRSFRETGGRCAIRSFALGHLADAKLQTTHKICSRLSALAKRSETISEMNRRIGMPLYIPLLSLIGCFLLSSRKESKNSEYFKYIYFFLGFIVLIFAEVSLRYSGKITQVSMMYYLVPLVSVILMYLILIRIFKYENLK